jgi:hypothetical protein
MDVVSFAFYPFTLSGLGANTSFDAMTEQFFCLFAAFAELQNTRKNTLNNVNEKISLN